MHAKTSVENFQNDIHNLAKHSWLLFLQIFILLGTKSNMASYYIYQLVLAIVLFSASGTISALWPNFLYIIIIMF